MLLDVGMISLFDSVICIILIYWYVGAIKEEKKPTASSNKKDYEHYFFLNLCLKACNRPLSHVKSISKRPKLHK